MTRDLMWRWHAWARGKWTNADVRDLSGWANAIHAATRSSLLDGRE